MQMQATSSPSDPPLGMSVALLSFVHSLISILALYLAINVWDEARASQEDYWREGIARVELCVAVSALGVVVSAVSAVFVCMGRCWQWKVVWVLLVLNAIVGILAMVGGVLLGSFVSGLRYG
jgi:hypothetical protein